MNFLHNITFVWKHCKLVLSLCTDYRTLPDTNKRKWWHYIDSTLVMTVWILVTLCTFVMPTYDPACCWQCEAYVTLHRLYPCDDSVNFSDTMYLCHADIIPGLLLTVWEFYVTLHRLYPGDDHVNFNDTTYLGHADRRTGLLLTVWEFYVTLYTFVMTVWGFLWH